MLRAIVLSTLFPSQARPLFGTFVERQTLGLAARPDVELRIVVPRALPPFPLSQLGRYRTDARLPQQESWHGITLYRPRFLHLPRIGVRHDAAMMTRVLLPLLRDIRREFPFDIIAAEYFFPDGPAAVALGRALGVPVSIKARGSDINSWGHHPATGAQVRAAGAAADGMLAVSAAMKREMISLGMAQDRIRVHYTGIDRSLFHVRDRGAAKAALGISGPLIVTVAPLIERKGISLVVEALASLPDARLVVAGAGPDESRLLALAQQHGVSDRVRLLGLQPRAAVADWLAAADVMALPSASEGLANAWVEALASGTPIVIADVGGARELLAETSGGRLVARTPAAVAGGIAELLAAPPDRDAVARVVDRFSWEANAAALHAHLAALVVGRS